jgi:hypothetical protein
MVLVAIFKRRIFGDPIARFLSLLFIDDPNPADKDESSDTTDQPGKNTRP